MFIPITTIFNPILLGPAVTTFLSDFTQGANPFQCKGMLQSGILSAPRRDQVIGNINNVIRFLLGNQWEDKLVHIPMSGVCLTTECRHNRVAIHYSLFMDSSHLLRVAIHHAPQGLQRTTFRNLLLLCHHRKVMSSLTGGILLDTIVMNPLLLSR